jgi:hypothetical protein
MTVTNELHQQSGCFNGDACCSAQSEKRGVLGLNGVNPLLKIKTPWARENPRRQKRASDGEISWCVAHPKFRPSHDDLADYTK